MFLMYVEHFSATYRPTEQTFFANFQTLFVTRQPYCIFREDWHQTMPSEGTAAGHIAAPFILYGGALGANTTGENIPRSMA